MQNWSDNTMVTQRGYAERVVEIRLRPDEGGMNLDMDEELILTLVLRGAEAGDELLTFDWDAHRVIRYRAAMSRLSESFEEFRASWGTLDYAGLIDTYPAKKAGASSYLGGPTWRAKDTTATTNLVEVVDQWQADGWPALRADRPRPSPVIRWGPSRGQEAWKWVVIAGALLWLFVATVVCIAHGYGQLSR